MQDSVALIKRGGSPAFIQTPQITELRQSSKRDIVKDKPLFAS